MKKYKQFFLIAAVAGSMLLLACNRETVLTIYTSISEVTLYAELYNSAHQNTTIVVKYYENPLDYVDTPPDIVIGNNIAHSNMPKKLVPLTRVKYDFNIYPDLLESGVIDGIQYLLPLAFDLPIIEFIPENIGEYEQAFWISPTELEVLGSKYTTITRSTLTRLGFLPGWSNEFLYEYLKLRGVNFHSNKNGRLIWNPEILQSALESLQQWTQKLTNDSTKDFNEQYISDKYQRALTQNYLAYRYSTLSEFFSIPHKQRVNKDFLWLSNGNKMYTLDNVVYVGLARQINRKTTDFLRWLFSIEAQVLLLNTKKNNHLPEFGIAGMLSSLPKANEDILPQYYHQLADKMPSRHLITTTKAQIPDWEKFKHDVFYTWLTQSIHNFSSKPFEAIVEEWYLSTSK